jgi:hypothetical protein
VLLHHRRRSGLLLVVHLGLRGGLRRDLRAGGRDITPRARLEGRYGRQHVCAQRGGRRARRCGSGELLRRRDVLRQRLVLRHRGVLHRHRVLRLGDRHRCLLHRHGRSHRSGRVRLRRKLRRGEVRLGLRLVLVVRVLLHVVCLSGGRRHGGRAVCRVRGKRGLAAMHDACDAVGRDA